MTVGLPESIGLLTVTSVCHSVLQHTVFNLDSHSADQTHTLGIWQAQFEANKVALALDEETETLMSDQLCAMRGSELADARDDITLPDLRTRAKLALIKGWKRNICHLKRNN